MGHGHEGPSAVSEALDQARDILLKPRLRLDAEAAWLVALDPADRSRLLGAVVRKPLADAINAADAMPPLARANATAHLCGHFQGEPMSVLTDRFNDLFDLHAAVLRVIGRKGSSRSDGLACGRGRRQGVQAQDGRERF